MQHPASCRLYSQNCWIDWNSAVLCFKWLFHTVVWLFTWPYFVYGKFGALIFIYFLLKIVQYVFNYLFKKTFKQIRNCWKKIIISSGWNPRSNFFICWTFVAPANNFSCFDDGTCTGAHKQPSSQWSGCRRVYGISLCVCVSGHGARVRVQNLSLVHNTGKIPKELFGHTLYFAARLTFLITKFNESNTGHSKLWLLLKYLFVKSKKNRLPLCIAIFTWISSISGLNSYNYMSFILPTSVSV